MEGIYNHQEKEGFAQFKALTKTLRSVRLSIEGIWEYSEISTESGNWFVDMQEFGMRHNTKILDRTLADVGDRTLRRSLRSVDLDRPLEID